MLIAFNKPFNVLCQFTDGAGHPLTMTGFKLVVCADNSPERLCRLFNEEGVMKGP